MVGFVIKIINGLVNGSAEVIILLLSILPNSPFRFDAILDNKLVSYICYFVPVAEMIAITVTWLSAIVFWYGVQIGLRWVKAIE